MPAITGTAGGRNGTAPQGPQVEFYRALLTGGVEFATLDRHVRGCATPVNVSMVVNNACNLSCRHCYLQVPALADRALSESECPTRRTGRRADETSRWDNAGPSRRAAGGCLAWHHKSGRADPNRGRSAGAPIA